MKKLFKRDEHKEKATNSPGRFALWKRKKDEAGTSDDKQDRCREGTPDSATLFESDPLKAVDSSNVPPQTKDSSTAPLNLDDEFQNVPISQLWNLAYEKLKKEDKTRIKEYEKILQESVTIDIGSAPDTKEDRRKWMSSVLKNKMEQVQKEAWKIVFLGSEIRLAHLVEPTLKVIKLVNDSITEAVIPSPYASLAWVGISVLVSVCLNPQHQSEALANGLREISSLILQGGMREDLYHRRYEVGNKANRQLSKTHETYKATLEQLYQKILKFQVYCYCYYARGTTSRVVRDLAKMEDWDGLIEEIRQQEAQMAAIDKLWRDQQYEEECAAAERRYQGTILNLKTIGAVVSELRKAVKDANRDRNQQELLNWLCDIDPSTLYNAARNRHKDGTSEWLIKENEQFKFWEQTPRSLLWLNGKAGSGKSVLSSSVIRHLEKEYINDASIAIIYFYFSFSDVKKQERDGMLASLLKQICCQRPNMPDSVKVLGELKKEGKRPCTEDLENSLITATYGFSAVYIVIDALDECPELNGQREQLMETLHHILAAESDNLHLFCTSRKVSDINASLCRYLSEPTRVEISLSAYLWKIERDIGLYINSTLADANYNSWPDDIKTEAKRILIAKSDGMFQYVRCQFEALRKLRSPHSILQALKDLPQGLDETYNRMFQGIDNKYREPVSNSLKWLAFSMEPLTTDNLAEIFIMHPDNDGAVILETERFFSAGDVLTYFSGLILEDQGIVRLTHFSIKEYLTSNRVPQDLSPAFSFSDIDAHAFIAYSCITYRNYLSTLLNGVDEKIYSLKEYAVSKWIFHLEMIPREFWSGEVTENLARMLAIRSHSLTNIILESFKREELRGTKSLEYTCFTNSPLRPYCFTAYHGFTRVTNYLFSQEFNAGKYSTQGDLNTALWYAVYNGRKEVATLLLNKGADANTSKTTIIDIEYSDQHGDVLQIAVSKGDFEMVNLLLDRGADIDAQRGGSALQTAAGGGRLDMLKLLVGRRADINGPSNEKGCVLSAAIKHERCFQYLLDNGADVNMCGTGKGEFSALCEAARVAAQYRYRNCDWTQFDLLLERGADVNIGGEGGYPLHEVIVSGDLPRIKQLLSLGADPNAKGGDYDTALHAVYFHKRYGVGLIPFYIQVTQLLIDNGADVNECACASREVWFGKAGTHSMLQISAYLGYASLVKLLLQNGADINLQAGRLGSALQAACIKGNLEMMQLLLDHGADVNAQGGYYGSALHAVCASISPKLEISRDHAIRLLLQHGADVNVLSSEHGSVLQTACRHVSYEVPTSMVPLLLDNGANVNAQGGHYGTALQAACIRSPSMVQLLLDHGADINAVCGAYGTALQAACHIRELDIVQLLLDHGADINAVGGVYGTALQAACSRSKRDLIQLLLDRGADANANGGQCETALQMSSFWGEIEVTRMLLERGADPLLRRGKRGSPLQNAAVNVETDTLLLLLEYGVDINLLDNDFGTILYFILSPERSRLEQSWQGGRETSWIDRIRFLLEHGAYANLRGGEYGFPLHAACAVTYNYNLVREIDNYISTVTFSSLKNSIDNQDDIMNSATEKLNVLLDECHDLDINAHGGIFGTALQAAAYSGQTKSIKLLLGRKDRVKCNERCGEYGSALNAAAIRGHWDIVELLLEAGEEPDCHLQQEPDEKFLAKLREEDGWAAEERYKKFWEVEKRNS